MKLVKAQIRVKLLQLALDLMGTLLK